MHLVLPCLPIMLGNYVAHKSNRCKFHYENSMHSATCSLTSSFPLSLSLSLPLYPLSSLFHSNYSTNRNNWSWSRSCSWIGCKSKTCNLEALLRNQLVVIFSWRLRLQQQRSLENRSRLWAEGGKFQIQSRILYLYVCNSIEFISQVAGQAHS